MRSGFFNSNITGYDDYGNPIYDRAEEASFFAEFFADFIGNGVYPNPSTGMQVIADEGMNLKVQTGSCFIKGYRGKVEEVGEIVTLEQADTNYSRIDRIVARLNLEAREIELHVLKGTPGTNPIAQDLTRNSNIYELALADVTVGKNVSVITQANIADTRLNTSLCGIVSGVIEQVDMTTLFNQYQSWFEEKQAQSDTDYQQWFNDFSELSETEFNVWFNTIKNKLNEDVAGSLQTQIDELSVKCRVKTLNLANWVKNETTGNYEYSIVDPEVTANHLIEGYMDLENQAKMVDGYIESYDGGYKIMTSELPTEAITMNMSIQKVGVIE